MHVFQQEHPPNLMQTRELMYGIIDVIQSNLSKIYSLRYHKTIKPDGSPVTPADIFIENLINNYLKSHIHSLYFIGEESFKIKTKSSPISNYCAILDPIDGTENFCSGLKEWGVSFTLWHKKKHLGSLLYMPELDDYLMTGDIFDPIQSRIRGFSSSICDDILVSISETQESRLMGCAVYNMYNVIRGSFSRFTNPRGAYVWDLLPGLMLAYEHNCDIRVEGKIYNGEFLSPNKKYCIDIKH